VSRYTPTPIVTPSIDDAAVTGSVIVIVLPIVPLPVIARRQFATTFCPSLLYVPLVIVCVTEPDCVTVVVHVSGVP
jgi:hypothetical protein